MIWIDSSFAIEWLIGTKRAQNVSLPKRKRAILPQQYTEILAFFGKKMKDLTPVIEELEGLALQNASKHDLQFAAQLYLEARQKKSKASLADAVLAAVATLNKKPVCTFDRDFQHLGFQESNSQKGVWEALEK